MIRAAMDDWHAGVLITDAAGFIEYANRSFETTSGYSGAELIGRPIASRPVLSKMNRNPRSVIFRESRWLSQPPNIGSIRV